MNTGFPNDLQLIVTGMELREENDGVMVSILRRIKFIEDVWGHKPILITTSYNVNLALLEALHSDPGKGSTQTRLNPDTRIFGVFDYFLDTYPYNQNHDMIEHPMRADKELIYAPLNQSTNMYAVFDRFARLLRNEFFTLRGDKLSHIDYFDEDKKRTKTLHFDYLGYMTKATIWDPNVADYHPAELFYDTNKKMRIRAEYKYIANPAESKILSNQVGKNKNELVQYSFYGDNGEELGTLDSHEELIALCLNCITDDPNMKYIISDESYMNHGAGTMVLKNNVTNTTVIHNTFLESPNDLRSRPQPVYEFVCENRKLYDAIVHLTKECKVDFEKKYETSNRHYVITHPYPFEIERADFDKRDHKKAVITSRLFEQKRIDRAIDIFAMVLKEVPDATLDIYGFGEDERKLREQIDKLGIGNNVKLMGFTDKAATVMSEAACFLMTSAHEGLGLVLLEAVSNGCPPFAYNIRYGPAHIIKNHVTGFHFKENDKRAFAKQLIKFFQDKEMQRRMSEACYEDAPRFSVENYLNNYWQLFGNLYNKMDERMKEAAAEARN